MTTCPRTVADVPSDSCALLGLARVPWTMRVRGETLVVRPSTARDIALVAQLNSRCSPQSLLDRYHRGGRPPTVAALDRSVRNPASCVVVRRDGTAVAHAAAHRDTEHGSGCAEVDLLVEDRWQQRGIGAELMAHVAGVARASGYAELVAYPATAVAVARRLMIEIGRTRMVPDARAHLHTYLPDTATLGLGSVRERLAG